MKKRIHYLIKTRMQLGLVLRFFIIISMLFAFVGFEAYITIWPVAAEFVPDVSMDLMNRLILMRFLYFVIPILFVMAAVTIIFSHRIAGPIYRIERTLDELIEGQDVARIHLRRGDELKGLAGRMNKLILLIEELRKANCGDVQDPEGGRVSKFEPLQDVASSGGSTG
jgi:sensor histidine kinase YesM